MAEKCTATGTYGSAAEGELDVFAILNAFDHVLNDIVRQSDGESLIRGDCASSARGIQLQASIGHS